MSRVRTILGLVAGLVLIASSAAHSLLGWPGLRTQLDAMHAPSDLIAGLALGWHFAGGAMLAMGIVTVATFAARLRGAARSTFPTAVFGVFYVIAGIGANVAAGVNGFFIGVFIVPGLLLLVASLGAARDA